MAAIFSWAAASDVSVSTTGSQTSSLLLPSTNQYVGGTFVITENTSSRNVTGITITENGTVNAATNLDNIKLFYDLDTTSPYDCASESYGGGETQFGSTDTDGFSAANGTSAFTGSVAISTTQTMCAYGVLDVGSAVSVKWWKSHSSSGTVIMPPVLRARALGTRLTPAG